jgi:hypothetical protein
MFRGRRAWLRVSPFLEHEMSRKAWRGTAEAAAIPGGRPRRADLPIWYQRTRDGQMAAFTRPGI